MLQTFTCFCGQPWALSSVSGETLNAFLSSNSYDEESPTSPTHHVATVEQMFDQVESIAKSKPIKFSAAYDANNGRPVNFSGVGSRCMGDTFFGTKAEFIDVAQMTKLAEATPCSAGAITDVNGTWEVIKAPMWQLGFAPVTVVVNPDLNDFKLYLPDPTHYVTPIQFYAPSGTSVTLSYEAWANPSEPWCPSTMGKYYREPFLSVHTATDWVLWTPLRDERGEWRQDIQWQFRRKSTP